MKRKKKGTLTLISNIVVTIFLVILFLIALILLFYIISNAVADKKGLKAPIRFYTIVSPSMEPNINVYDVIISTRVDQDADLKIGDVITFYSKTMATGEYTVTHRIYDIQYQDGKTYYVTKGDNNTNVDDGLITLDDIQGKVWKVIPQAGRIQKFLSSKFGWILIIVIPALCILLIDLKKIKNIFKIKKKMDNIPKLKDVDDYKEKEENKRVRALIEKADRINKK